MRGTAHRYSELGTITIPDDVPDVGIESGAIGTIVDISPSGILAVEVSNDAGATLDILDVRLDPAPHVIGRWHMGEG